LPKARQTMNRLAMQENMFFVYSRLSARSLRKTLEYLLTVLY